MYVEGRYEESIVLAEEDNMRRVALAVMEWLTCCSSARAQSTNLELVQSLLALMAEAVAEAASLGLKDKAAVWAARRDRMVRAVDVEGDFAAVREVCAEVVRGRA